VPELAGGVPEVQAVVGRRVSEPDPGFVAEAREAAAQALADALAAELRPFRWTVAAILPRPWLERIARRQLSVLLALPAPTRAALLGEPR
jgi:hypothetical protein